MEGDKIRVLAKRTDSGWYVTNVSNSLENLQRFVGGYIETVTIARDLVIICNEEGRIKGLPYNCAICGIDFVGDILVAGVDADEFCDVPCTLKDWKEINGC